MSPHDYPPPHSDEGCVCCKWWRQQEEEAKSAEKGQGEQVEGTDKDFHESQANGFANGD